MFCPIQTFSSVHLSHVWICNPMDHSTPGFCVHHQLVECIQPHVHWVGDAIQPSHPLSSPSPPAFSLSQHQVFSKKSLHQVAKVLELQLQHQSFQRLCRTDFLSDWLVWSPCKSKELSRPSVPFRGNTVAIHGEGNGTHSSALAWKIPWTEEPGGLQSMGLQRVGYDWATSLSLFTSVHWRRKWQPTPVFLPGESQGRGSLVGCHLWGCTESDTTEAA